MDKKILAVASFDKEKYYLDEEYNELPESIKEELKIMCVTLANKLMCTFIVGFYEDDGEVYFETIQGEEIIDFDDIGAGLEIKKIQREKSEFIKSLQLWYVVYKTSEGEKIKEELLKSQG